jgi:hypothetical protein
MSESFAATLANVFVAPSEAFQSIAERPRWEAPLLLAIGIGLAFTAVWMTKADPQQFMRAQMEETGALDRVPVEKRAEVLQGQARVFRAFAWVGPLFFAPLMYAALAGLFLVVFRFFYAAELRYPQSLGVVVWTFAAYALVTTPLILLVMSLRGEWSVDPQAAIQANAAALLDRASASKPLYAMATSLDLFSLWVLFLLSTGYAAAAKVRRGAAAWGVVVPWAVFVLGKGALAALF